MDVGTALVVLAILMLIAILALTIRDINRRPAEEGILAAIKTPSVAKWFLGIGIVLIYLAYELANFD